MWPVGVWVECNFDFHTSMIRDQYITMSITWNTTVADFKFCPSSQYKKIGNGIPSVILFSLHCDMINARSEQYNLAGFDQPFWSIIEVKTDSDSDAEGIKSSSLRRSIGLQRTLNPSFCTVLVRYSIHSLTTSEMLKIEYGCNPTGMTATLRRRKAVLQLAREHDFIILEGTYPFFIPSRIVNLTI